MNILFFFTDDQRFDTIAALGNPAIHTPNLDRLVQRGTSFTQAHIMGGTSAAVCMPSRAMMLTGRGLFDIDDMGQVIPSGHTTMGEVFRSAGWQTFGTGKWHNGPTAFNRCFEGGAEIYFGGMADHWNVPASHYDPSGKYDSRLPLCADPMTTNRLIWRQCDHVHAGRHSTELFADATLDFLSQRDRQRPFFAYVSFMAPHDPRTMPEKFLEMVDPDSIELPPNFQSEHPFDNGELRIRDELLEAWPRTPDAIRGHLVEYYAMISHIDAEIGRVLDRLEADGLLEETLIVFAGDNGLALGQHGLMGKQNLYDHSVRVPLVFAGPGIPVGVRTAAPCYLLDIFPTLCDLAGLRCPRTVQGRSLVPCLKDPQVRPRDALYLAYRDLQRAVVRDGFKLIEYCVGGNRRTQLFDLASDPWETLDLAGDATHANRMELMRKELLQQRELWNDHREREAAFWSVFHDSSARQLPDKSRKSQR